MKKFLASVAMLLFAVPVFADDTAAPAAASMPAAVQAPMAKKAKGHMSTKDEAGIKKTFSKVSEAWAAADAHGVASYFTEDSSIINPMGIEGHGREGVQKVVEAEFAGPMKGTQQTFDDFSFTWVMPNFALVDCTGTATGMKNADGTDAEPMKVHVYGVIVNRGKGWYARAIRAFAFLKPPTAAVASDDEAPAVASDKKAPDEGTDKKTDDSKK